MKKCSVPDCSSKATARGMCSMHYRRVRRHGSTESLSLAGIPPERRFEMFVDRAAPGGCWLWTGTLSSTGCGTIAENGKSHNAYRWAYERRVGPIPDGLVLDHLCRNRACCNPAHLEPVTQAVNIYRGDSPAAINKRKSHCIEGHEFTPENTYTRPDNGNRQCRTCNAERRRLRTARERAKS